MLTILFLFAFYADAVTPFQLYPTNSAPINTLHPEINYVHMQTPWYGWINHIRPSTNTSLPADTGLDRRLHSMDLNPTFGPEYSSDNTADGPVINKHTETDSQEEEASPIETPASSTLSTESSSASSVSSSSSSSSASSAQPPIRQKDSINTRFRLTDNTLPRYELHEIVPGTPIEVQLETFPSPLKLNLQLTEAINSYAVVGYYVSIDTTGPNGAEYYVEFEEISTSYWLSHEWVEAYGLYKSLNRNLAKAKTPLLRCLHASSRSQLAEANSRSGKLTDMIDIVKHGICDDTTKGICYLNIDSLKTPKLELCSWLSKEHNIGLICLVDTRHTESLLSVTRKAWSDSVDDGYIWGSSRGTISKIGGTLFLCNAQFTKAFRKAWEDPSKLGIIYENSFHTSHGVLRVLSIYWPVPLVGELETSQQLIADLIIWLRANWPHQDPGRYIKEMLTARILKESWQTVVGGDFNASADDPQLAFISELGMSRVHADCGHFFTRFCGSAPSSQIDHIYSSAAQVGAGYSESPILRAYSDHRPVMGYFGIGMQEEQRSPRFKPPEFRIRNLKKMNTADKQEFNLKLRLRLQDLVVGSSEYLETFTHEVVSLLKIPIPRKYRQFWSDKVQAHKIYAMFLEKHKRRLLQQQTFQQEDINLLKRAYEPSSEICKKELHEILAHSALISTVAGPTSSSFEERYQSEIDGAYSKLHKSSRLEILNEIRNIMRNIDASTSAAHRYLGKGRPRNNLDVVIEGDQVRDQPELVHEAVVRRQSRSFGAPTNPLPSDLWEHSQTLPDFTRALNKDYVPAEQVGIVHKAVLMHGADLSEGTQRAQLVEKLQSLDDGPTFEEFKQAIRLSPRKRSGGPSGLTYDMLRLVEEDIILKVYEQLRAIWSTKRFPTWMRFKHLVPLPKIDTDVLNVEQIRPIMLIEILRKLWLRPMVNRIRSTWQEQGVLVATQYGFLSERSCAHAIMQLINVLEQAKYENRSLYFSTFDISKAFDTVQRPFAEMALRRLGVPKETAHAFAFIDEDDEILVLTPWAKQQAEATRFSSYIGCGQGDIQSPLIWTAVMDILLTSVKLAAPSDITYPLQHGQFAFGRDIAYADDFDCLCRYLANLSKKTTTYSAATMCFGLKLAPEKFRAFCVNPIERSPTITVYLDGWIAKEVRLEKDGHIKYLGSNQDLNLSGKTDLAKMRSILEESLSRLALRKCGAHTVAMYIRSALLPKLLYPGSFSTAPLADFEKMDKEIGKMMKGKIHLPDGFPCALLNGSHKQGAIGLPILSEEITMRKFQLFHALQRADTATRQALDGMIYRQLHMHSSHKDETCILRPSKDHRSWLNSLTDGLALHGLSEQASIHPQIVTTLEYGDIYARIGQQVVSTYYEIVGWNRSVVYFILWGLENPRTSGRHLSTTSIIPQSQLQKAPWIEISTWTHKVTSTGNHCKRICSKLTELEAPIGFDVNPAQIAIPLLPTPTLTPGLLICTDGSWKRELTGPFPGNHNTKAGAAIVVLDSKRRVIEALRISDLHASSDKRAYVQEFIGLTAASFICSELTNPTIHSDCLAALTKVQNTCRQYPLRPYCSAIKQSDGSRHWVKGHPDRLKLFAELTPPEFGNIVADLVADGSHKYQWKEIHRDHFISNIRQSNKWLHFSIPLGVAFSVQLEQNPLVQRSGPWALFSELCPMQVLLVRGEPPHATFPAKFAVETVEIDQDNFSETPSPYGYDPPGNIPPTPHSAPPLAVPRKPPDPILGLGASELKPLHHGAHPLNKPGKIPTVTTTNVNNHNIVQNNSIEKHVNSRVDSYVKLEKYI
jgi:hypothetical protein